MLAEDRGRIAENQELILVQNARLWPRQVFNAEKTPALPYGLGVDLCSGADNAPRIKLEPYREALARDLTEPYRIKRRVSGRQLRPRFLLINEQAGCELGERASR